MAVDDSLDENHEDEDIGGVRFKDYYVISREFESESEKGVGVLGALSEDVFNGLFLVGEKLVDEDSVISKDAFPNLELSVNMEEEEDFKSKDLEESVGFSNEVVKEEGGSDFYKARGGGVDFYNEKKYDEKNPEEFYDELIVDGKADFFVSPKDDPVGPDGEALKGRSMLEIVGFRDEEAEKKREEMRRLRWG